MDEKPLPYIKINVISTTETNLSERAILAIVEAKFKQRYNVKTSWEKEGTKITLYVDFPTQKAYQKVYSYGFGVLNLIIKENSRPNSYFKSIFDQMRQSQTQEVSRGNLDRQNYLVLKYMTNVKAPMRRFYEFSVNICHFINIGFYTEEIGDGFLHFYETQTDFIECQLDTMKISEILKWMKKRNIDLTHPAVKRVKKYLAKSIKTK